MKCRPRKSPCISRNRRICSASAFRTRNRFRYLTKLGLNIVKQEPGECTFKIPSWRVDLKREVDLIEEVGRLYGIEKIPSTPPRGALGANAFDSVYDQIGEARRILTGLGLNEAQGQTLVAKEECRIKHEEIVALANPLSSDMDVLRPSLLPGLIHSLRHNVSRKNDDVALFEIGRVFTNANGQIEGKTQRGHRHYRPACPALLELAANVTRNSTLMI